MSDMLKGYRGAAAVLGLAALVAACNGGEASQPEEGEVAAAAAVRAVNVEVMELQPTTFEEVLRVTGTVQANRDVVVSAEESGLVRRIFVEKGAAVSTGQPLVKIDDAVLRTQVDQARAVADLAAETHERRRRLWEEDQVGSELAYLQAKYEAEQAAATLATLRERLERTTVRAPFSGLLEERRVEVGTMVAPGTPLVRLVDISPVKVSGGVPERYARQVSPGREVEIAIDALDGENVSGAVSFVGSTVNEQNRTFPIEVVIDNPGGLIKPEMVASIHLPLRQVEDALVVPQQALVRTEGGFMAYVVTERDGAQVAEARTVTLGSSQANLVQVRSGLEAGDRLIVVGQQRVAEGDPVVVVARQEGDER